MKQCAWGLLALGALAAPAAGQLVPLRLPDPPATTSEPSGIGRKMEVLEVAGLNIPPTSLQESVVLSARQPWIDSRTFVDFNRAINYSIRQNSASIAGVPHLSFAHTVPPHAELVWNSDPSKRHIIDCEVGGTASHIKFRWTEPAGEASAAIAKGRVSTVLPTGVPGSVKLSADKNWNFHSCEITPVAI